MSLSWNDLYQGLGYYQQAQTGEEMMNGSQAVNPVDQRAEVSSVNSGVSSDYHSTFVTPGGMDDALDRLCNLCCLPAKRDYISF